MTTPRPLLRKSTVLALGTALLAGCAGAAPPNAAPSTPRTGGGGGPAAVAGPASPAGPAAPGAAPTSGPTVASTGTLSGHVYAAKSAAADPATGQPTGYQPAPDGTQVSIQVIGAYSSGLTATVSHGTYTVANVPLHARLLVTASYPGLAPRSQQLAITSGTAATLDFTAANGGCLLDQPEVVGVAASGLVGGHLDPDQPITFTIKFSEALDPSTFDPMGFVLSSTDVPGLTVTDGMSLFGNTVHVSLAAPDTVVFATGCPLANLRKGHAYPTVTLTYGQGALREAAGGVVLGGSAQAVAGSNLTGSAVDTTPTLAFSFWTNDSNPSLKSAQYMGTAAVASASAAVVQFTWSEAMDVMLNAKTASGSYDPSILMGSAYQVATASAKAGPFAAGGASMSHLAITGTNRTSAYLMGVQSGDWVQVTPTCANPEGNSATGSLVFQVP